MQIAMAVMTVMENHLRMQQPLIVPQAAHVSSEMVVELRVVNMVSVSGLTRHVLSRKPLRLLSV